MLRFSNSPQSIRRNFLVKLLYNKSVLNSNCNLLFKNTHFSEEYKSSGWTSAKTSFALQPLCFLDLNHPQLPSLYTSDIYEIYSQCVLCLLAGVQHYSHYQIPLSVITQGEGKVQARQPNLSAKKDNVFSSPMLKKEVLFFPHTSKKGAWGDKGLILSSVLSKGMEDNLRGMKGRAWREEKKKKESKKSMIISSFCPILSLAITASHTPLCFWGHISLSWGSCKPSVISAPQRLQGVHSTGYHLKKGGIWKPMCETDEDSLCQGSQFSGALASLFPPNRRPQEQRPRVLSAKRTWPDPALTEALPTRSCAFPVEMRDHLPLGMVSLTAKSWFSCDFLGEGSGPFTQHENRERYPAGKLQLIKDKCSYTGSWKMRAGW